MCGKWKRDEIDFDSTFEATRESQGEGIERKDRNEKLKRQNLNVERRKNMKAK